MNRIRLLLITTFVVAVTAFSSGFGVTYADQAPAAAAPDSSAAQQQDPAAAKRKAAAATKARAIRDAAIKKRRDAKEYINKVVEGQQPGAASPAPDNTGKEGAQ